jgi:hypothetical protein
MGRGVALVGLALLVALPAAAAPGRVPRAATSPDGTILIGGVPRFLIGAGWPTTTAVPRALTLGIGTFQENGPGATQSAISQAVGTKGYVVPAYSAKHRRADYVNLIGYSLPDEPDGNGLLPADADPDAGPRLPYTRRARRTGVLIMQTLTSHFMRARSKYPGIGDAEYRGYIRNADVVLATVYPFAHGCVDPGVTLSTVYDSMVELKALAPAKAVGQWIETGPIEGYCGASTVTPEQAHAEAWAAVAGGAQALFWFTHTFTKGYWDDFDVSPEMAAAMAATNAELAGYTPIVLGHRFAGVVSAPSDPVKVGLRSFNRRLYLIAVNLSDQPADLAGASWWSKLPSLTVQSVEELTTGWSGAAAGGRFADTIPAFALRIYSWLPQKVIRGHGL